MPRHKLFKPGSVRHKYLIGPIELNAHMAVKLWHSKLPPTVCKGKGKHVIKVLGKFSSVIVNIPIITCLVLRMWSMCGEDFKTSTRLSTLPFSPKINSTCVFSPDQLFKRPKQSSISVQTQPTLNRWAAKKFQVKSQRQRGE